MSEVFESSPFFFFTLMTFFSLFPFNREQPFIVRNQNKRLTFSVTLKNKQESAYNTAIVVDFSENLFFASWSMPVRDDTPCLLLSFPTPCQLPSACPPPSTSSGLSDESS